MSKTITIKTDHEYAGKNRKMTVGEALDWVEKHATVEDEESGEVDTYEPGDLIVYAVFRLMALSKDNKRHRSGKLASHLYAPRLDTVEEKPRGLAPIVEEVHKIADRLAPKEEKPAKVKAPRKPKAKKVKAPKKPAVEQGNPEVASAL